MQLFAAETPSERINGAQIRVVIQAELAEYGLLVEPSIKPDRLFRTATAILRSKKPLVVGKPFE